MPLFRARDALGMPGSINNETTYYGPGNITERFYHIFQTLLILQEQLQ